jgi:hypothetical protein
MINVEELIYDEDFAQGYTVYRETCTWSGGRTVTAEDTLNYTGVVTAATPKELIILPEADRVSGMMTFYSGSEYPLYTTRLALTTSTDSDGKDGTSDQLEWHGMRYKIIKVWPYTDYGYWKALATRMEGA